MDLDIVVNKIATIERCLERVRKTYNEDSKNLEDLDKQDIIILNIQRVCEAAIDISMHICAQQGLGIPQANADAFGFLFEKGVITSELHQSLKSMVGFRNVAVHDYQKLNLKILRAVIEEHLQDLTEFTESILKANKLEIEAKEL